MEKQNKVLIADEDKEFIKAIKETCMAEFVVDEAVGGEEAKNKIENNIYDAIVMDVMLSQIDGYELLEILKSRNNKAKIIVVSNIYSNNFIQKALNMGANYYMIKPVSTNALMERIKDVLKTPIEEKPVVVKNVDSKNRYIEEKITNIFITVGIPAHIKGYQFLREAIKMAIDNPDIINSITKKL